MTRVLDPTAPVTHRAGPALGALALGAFGIGLTEFAIAGLLTPVADDLGVSVSAAGQLVSGYALAVVFGALTLTPFLLHRPPRTALLVFMALFVAGNVVSAAATDYGVMMIGRVIAALCHGGFFGLGAVVAGDLVAPQRRAQAISAMFAGLTVANVLGVPVGTWVGQSLSWRATFWLIALVGAVALVALRAAVPSLPARDDGPVRAQLTVLTDRRVLLPMLTTAAVFGGVIGAFTYVEPLVTRVTGFGEGAVPWLLVVFGGGLVAGNIVGGRLADRWLTTTLLALTGALPVVLAAYALGADNRVLTVLLLAVLGFVGFATVPGLQLRALAHAGGAPVMASAGNIAAFNLGNAIGVAAGGFVLAHVGLTAPAWAGATLCLVGFVLVAVTSRASS